MKKLITLVSFVFISTIFAYSQNNKLSINTQRLITEINNSNNTLLKSSTEKYSKIGAYIIIENGADPYSLEEFDVDVNMVLDTIISARIPLEAIDEISNLDIVKKIDAGGRAKQIGRAHV